MMNTSFRCTVLVLAVSAVAFFFALPADAQERNSELPRVSPTASVSQVVGVTEITITYGRPSVRDRVIYGELVPYDVIWRTGADEATTITFEDDVTLEGEAVPAGTYSLFTVPGEEEWTVVLNEDADQWGAYSYNDEQDVLRVTTTPQVADFREMLTFVFEEVDEQSGTIALYWDEVRVPFEVETDTDAVVQKRAEETVRAADSWQEPLQFADYAMRNEVFLNDALQWVDHSIALQENYNNLYVKARLLAHRGDYREAVEVGEQAIEQAESQEQQPVTLDELKKEVADWRGNG